MLFLQTLVVAFAAFFGVFARGSSDVVILSAENFDETTQVATGEKGDWMVKFYAPWCGHCTKMAPAWDEFAATSQGVKVAKVDVTENRELATRFGIKGFPTLKFFSGGKVYDYSGARTVSAFKEFAEGGYTKTEGRRV